MKEFTREEIDSIVKAMSQEPPEEKEAPQIPVRRNSRTSIAKVSFGTLSEIEPPRPHAPQTEKEWGKWKNLKVRVEVMFGSSSLTLQELASLEPGSLVSFDQLAEEPVDIYVNGLKIGKGQVVAVEGHYGIKLLSLDEKSRNMVQ